MSELVGIGAAVFDTLLTTEGFPKEDTKLAATESLAQGGGPCATALVAARRLGIESEYLGTLGDDYHGQLVLDDFVRFGVETRHVVVKKGCHSFNSFIILNQLTGSRTCIWHRGTVPAPKADEIPVKAIRGAKVLHLDGHHLEAALSAARYAKKAGVKVCLDAGGVYLGIEELLPLVDLLMPSEEFALRFTKQNAAELAAQALYREYKPELIVITQGSRGGFIYNGEQYQYYPAFPVDVVDSNGAGDVFHGAFIAGYIKGMAYRSAAEFASAVSALKCTRLGARQSLPSFEKALAFLKQKQRGF